MEAEVTTVNNVFLNRGWQPFARAHGLQGRCTLHFRYVGVATLYVRVFGEDGRHLGCCPESDNDNDDDDDDGRRGGIIAGDDLALGDGRAASNSGGFSSVESSNDDDSDEPSHR